MFINNASLASTSWQAFERLVCRLLMYKGYTGVRLVGQTRDKGADIIAHRSGKRWLFQVKYWKQRVGATVIDETLSAMRVYRAQIPVVVSYGGFDSAAQESQRSLLSRGIPLQLWDQPTLLRMSKNLVDSPHDTRIPRDYQEETIQVLLKVFFDGFNNKALIVMATGLGKTFTVGETLRRIMVNRHLRVLVLAHTNELVYQLERNFWPILSVNHETIVWNGYEPQNPENLERVPLVFGCLNTVSDYVTAGNELPRFDVVVVDECHHIGGTMYSRILEETRAGQESGPFLLGMTATPWRPDEVDIKKIFGDPLVSLDLVTGLKKGYLSNVDYRIHTDNINWDSLKSLSKQRLSPKEINRTLFISQWDDAVVSELQKAWHEQAKPRAIVFCGTIEHAITMSERINARGFCNAAAIYSRIPGSANLEPSERNRILCDFQDGVINILCGVDILNEGVDVPDVNIIVFQRVTHSRRIFIQQLGRGLRLAPNKEKVIVLDFVSDIRRFAAGLDLKHQLSSDNNCKRVDRILRLNLPYKVTFKKLGKDDPIGESFLREWLEDVAAIESAGDDASVLKFPPVLT